jgi:hypothetical protein
MSVHEFESLVEMSVQVLDADQGAESAGLRSMFYHLYEFQHMWDTGFTQFRVMDMLLKHHFTYQMDMLAHPDYAAYRTILEQVAETSRQAGTASDDKYDVVQFIRVEPIDPRLERQMGWQEYKVLQQSNPVAAYYRYPFLYAETGSSLWRRLVETGRLTGVDAEPPDPRFTLVEIADTVVRCSHPIWHTKKRNGL